MSWLEAVTNFYLYFHENYGWSRKQVDASELDYLMDLVVVRDKVEHPEDQVCYIDEIPGI